MLSDKQLHQAIKTLIQGGIIVYPTESVYGLGCHPDNEQAVNTLLALKKRSVKKGLILIAAHVRQILPLIKPIHPDDLARALKTWPGHHTWVFPKSQRVPAWISGEFDSVAVRVSKHPVVVQLCTQLKSALVSTSANISNQPEFGSIETIKAAFADKIDCYLEAPVGNEAKPSTIHDAHSNTILR